ncbi:MAG: hypothetical protein KDB18_01605 [Salinibacterium sp.]|nr:hypothetical protein [Salinibacterium sp.]
MNDHPSLSNDTRAAMARACPLSPKEVSEFRAVVREETSVDMAESEAWNRAIELVALFRMLLGPLPEDRED